MAILQNPEVVNGKRIGFTSTWDKTLREYMEGFERVVGKPVRLHVRQPDDSIPKPLVEVIEWLKGFVPDLVGCSLPVARSSLSTCARSAGAAARQHTEHAGGATLGARSSWTRRAWCSSAS